MFLETIAVILLFLLILYVLSQLLQPKRLQLQGSHVVVTGGSSGIGKAVAIEAAKQGANVTLLARNQGKLQEAEAEIEKHFMDNTKQGVLCISVDVSESFSAVEKAMKQAEERFGPVDMLVNSAGFSVNGKFEEMPIEEFKRVMDVNYLGTVYATRAVIHTMKRRQRGRIVLVSSQAGQIGIFGYSAYAASKFALRGLAEALQMEVKAHNIYVSLVCPPDTDTPGMHEDTDRPRETSLIAETSGLWEANHVAKVIVEDAKCGRFLSYIGLDGYLVGIVTAGMSPVTSIIEGLQQILLMSIFRFVGFFYLMSFYGIVRRCKQEDDKKK